MYEIYAKTFFKGKFVYTSSFLVCVHLTTCAHAYEHSLEETLGIIQSRWQKDLTCHPWESKCKWNCSVMHEEKSLTTDRWRPK